MNRNMKSNRAVSPVVGVILMVAVTVILAAVIGTFVLDMGSSTQENPQAGVTFDENTETGEVTVQVLDAGNTDQIIVESEGARETLSGVGDSVTVDSYGEEVTVIGVTDRKQAVLQTHQPEYVYDGDVHHVEQTVANEVHTHTSITDALNEAGEGDTVIVHEGTYSSPTYTVNTDNVTIIGKDDPTITASSSVHGFDVQANNVVIEGLNFGDNIDAPVVLNGNDSHVEVSDSHSTIDNGDGNTVVDTNPEDDPTGELLRYIQDDSPTTSPDVSYTVQWEVQNVDNFQEVNVTFSNGNSYGSGTKVSSNSQGQVTFDKTGVSNTDYTITIEVIDSNGEIVLSETVSDVADGTNPPGNG